MLKNGVLILKVSFCYFVASLSTRSLSLSYRRCFAGFNYAIKHKAPIELKLKLEALKLSDDLESLA